jgi:hypothetical protein
MCEGAITLPNRKLEKDWGLSVLSEDTPPINGRTSTKPRRLLKVPPPKITMLKTKLFWEDRKTLTGASLPFLL